ncbi:MAG: glycosyltransferase family 4 protein [Ruminococcaceae bacterium]|nr:glycosyltransferase family 4 protein [Oscillospiraceae bacterium]
MKLLIYEANSGFTSYTKPLANAISERDGMSVSLMTSKGNKELNGISPCVSVLCDLDEYKAGLRHGSVRWLIDRMLVSWRNILHRNRVVAKSDYDVVLVEFTLPIIDQFYFKRLRKSSKVVLTVHDVIPPNRSRFWSMRSLKKLYRVADHLIVHSEENKRELIDRFQIAQDKISIIHHGVHANKALCDKSECRQRLNISEQENVVLFYGSIRPQKGLDNLIRALDGVDATLIIAGALPHGEDFTSYEQLIAKHGVKTLRMIEYVSDEMTDVLYGAADIVALPYKYFFSQSGVFMQAIQYHRLIAASDVSSFSSYVHRYELGLLCQPDDIRSLHATINEMAQNKELLYKNAKFEIALNDNSWEASADKHISLMRAISSMDHAKQ